MDAIHTRGMVLWGAFVAACALIVMLMLLPGLGLFHAGMARSKNVLSVMTQIFALIALICLLWVFFGYSLVFDTDTPLNAVIGGTSKFSLAGVSQDSMVGTIPEYLYVMFMMMFAAITPPLIIGAFAERMKFLAVLAIWLMINYVPMAHMALGRRLGFQCRRDGFCGRQCCSPECGGCRAGLCLGDRPAQGLWPDDDGPT